jgi:sulfur carrier protein ThiS
MFWRKKLITVNVKLFAGLDKEAKLEQYDPYKGVELEFPEGTRLRQVLKMLHLSQIKSVAYFIDGERIGLRTKLKQGDEISCLRPLGGG